MAWGYGGRNYGYSAPVPVDKEDAGVEESIKQLKAAIDVDKPKETLSALSELKLTTNNNFPLFTRDVAPFGAYLYAVNNKKKKTTDSLLKALLKKNYSYDGFPLATLIDNLSSADFGIIVRDVLDVSTQWNLEGVDLIDEMFKKYPKETETYINAGRLNKYEKGENRVLTTKKVIELGGKDAIIAALNTFFGHDYIEKYGINGSKLSDLFSAVDARSDDIKRYTRTHYFYKVAVKSITFDILEKDYVAGLLDEHAIKSYADMMIGNYRSTLFVTLRNMKNEELRISIIASNEQLLALVSKDHPDLMPKEVQDIFLF